MEYSIYLLDNDLIKLEPSVYPDSKSLIIVYEVEGVASSKTRDTCVEVKDGRKFHNEQQMQ
jgi:hypothetical protein